MSSKRYPEEFKIQAAKQVTEQGHSVQGVASRLGVSTHSMYSWLKRYGGPTGQQAATSEQAQQRYSRNRDENRQTLVSY